MIGSNTYGKGVGQSERKTYGQIVAFRTPAIYKKEVDTALLLYSNGGEDFVLAPTFEEAKKEFKRCVDILRNIATDPKDVQNLKTREEKRSFAKIIGSRE